MPFAELKADDSDDEESPSVEMNSDDGDEEENSEDSVNEENADDSDDEENVDDSADEGDADDSADDEIADDSDDEGNAGWADAFAKVLKQEKPKKISYKKIKVEEEPTTNELDLAAVERKERNNKLVQLRVKPGSMDRERERAFKRIATKGVVQLFNAVRSQQRDLVNRLEEAGPLDHKRDEVLNNINKRQFLDMLMGGKRAKSETVDNPVKDEKDADEDEARPSQWSVLRDDFMTSKKLKHWDKDEDEDGSDNNHADSDSN